MYVCASWVCLVPVDGRREHRIPIDCCEPPWDSYRDHCVCPLDPYRSLCVSIRSLSIIVSLRRIPIDRCEPPWDLYGSLWASIRSLLIIMSLRRIHMDHCESSVESLLIVVSLHVCAGKQTCILSKRSKCAYQLILLPNLLFSFLLCL